MCKRESGLTFLSTTSQDEVHADLCGHLELVSNIRVLTVHSWGREETGGLLPFVSPMSGQTVLWGCKSGDIVRPAIRKGLLGATEFMTVP